MLPSSFRRNTTKHGSPDRWRERVDAGESLVADTKARRGRPRQKTSATLRPSKRRRRRQFQEDNQSGSSTARRSHVAIRPKEVVGSRDRRDEQVARRSPVTGGDDVPSCRGSPETAHMGTEHLTLRSLRFCLTSRLLRSARGVTRAGGERR